jgi:RsbT co-antagonist protein rsbRD N-terminal domain
MPDTVFSHIVSVVAERRDEFLNEWVGLLKVAGALNSGQISESELRTDCRDFLASLMVGMAGAGSDAGASDYTRTEEILADLSRSRALQGFTPTETASFVFSLKEPLFNFISRKAAAQKARQRTSRRRHGKLRSFSIDSASLRLRPFQRPVTKSLHARAAKSRSYQRLSLS